VKAMWMGLALLACVTGSAHAHGGEDHGDEAPVVQTVHAPDEQARASTQTASFELVAVLRAPVLTLYIDRFDNNQPVSDATVELESGAFKAVAKASAPGVYTVQASELAQVGRHPLTVSVQTADDADLLNVVLHTAEHDEGKADHDQAKAAPWGRMVAWVVGAAALLGVLGALGGLWWWRRRHAARAGF
jgi:hypothetical protein